MHFPDILAFYESAEGQREFAEWEAQQAEKANQKNVPKGTEQIKIGKAIHSFAERFLASCRDSALLLTNTQKG